MFLHLITCPVSHTCTDTVRQVWEDPLTLMRARGAATAAAAAAGAAGAQRTVAKSSEAGRLVLTDMASYAAGAAGLLPQVCVSFAMCCVVLCCVTLCSVAELLYTVMTAVLNVFPSWCSLCLWLRSGTG